MITKFKTFLTDHPAARAALRVFVYTFISVFGLALMGFLSDVTEWATNDAPFPDVSVLGKAVAAGLTSAVSGLLALVYNKLPSTHSAQYSPPPANG